MSISLVHATCILAAVLLRITFFFGKGAHTDAQKLLHEWVTEAGDVSVQRGRLTQGGAERRDAAIRSTSRGRVAMANPCASEWGVPGGGFVPGRSLGDLEGVAVCC